jgi:hypothetical protein
MNIKLLLGLFIFISFNAASQTFTTSGNWGDAANWDPKTIPNSVSTDVTIKANVTVESNYSIGSVVVNSNEIVKINSSASLTVGSSALFNGTPPVYKNITFGNNAKLVVEAGGLLEVWGDLIIDNSMTFNLMGTLRVHGNIIMKNSGDVVITGSGNLIVGGSFTANNRLTIENLGNVEIVGTLTAGNGSTYTGGGTIDVGGCSSGAFNFCTIILPVELLYFRAGVVATGIQLDWASAKEWDFSHYTLERSANGRDYNPIHVAYVHGDSYTTKEYRYTDHQPQYGANYYRLKATDIDGTEEYKGVVLAYSGTKGDLELMPNPAKGGKVNLRYLGASEGTLVSILNASGLEMIRVEMQEQNMQLPISSLPRGLYIIKVWNQLESRQTRLIIP